MAAVIGVGTASAMFVDYLADRALMRTAKAPKAPAVQTEVAAVVAKPIVRQGRPAVAAAAPSAGKAQPKEQPDDKQVALADARAAAPNPLTIDPESTLVQSELADAGGPVSELSAFSETDVELSAFAETDGDESLTDVTYTGAIPSPRPDAAPPAEASSVVVAAETAEAKEESATGRQAKVTTAVNLRAGPKDEAKVLAVVPARETVQLINCNGWCEVVFQGQRGWIYKSFIRES